MKKRKFALVTKKKGITSKLVQMFYEHKVMDQKLLQLGGCAEEMKGILEKISLGKKKK